MKKILFIVHEGALSGANAALSEYMALLYDADFELFLITPRLGGLSEKVRNITKDIFEVYYYGWAVHPGTAQSLKSRLRIKARNIIGQRKIGKIIRSIKPDFIATNTITIKIGAVLSRRFRVKHVWFVHEFGEKDHTFSLPGGMVAGRKYILDNSEKVVVNSKAVGREFLPSSKLETVYNCVELNCNNPVREFRKDKFSFTVLGQIAPSKNQEEAVQALKIAVDGGYPFDLSMYGNIVTESYHQKIRELIDALGLQDCCTIHGYTKNVCAVFSQSDALIMCSRNEAFGRVTLEALQNGVPVIGANSGGTPEMVTDGFNGYLYKSGDEKDLAEKMIRLYKDFGQFKAKEISDEIKGRFNKERTLQQLLKVFS